MQAFRRNFGTIGFNFHIETKISHSVKTIIKYWSPDLLGVNDSSVTLKLYDFLDHCLHDIKFVNDT